MIVSDCLRFVFVHNPKCAGTVFRDAVRFAHDYPATFWHIQPSPRDGRPLDYAHLRLWEVRDLFPDVYERLRTLTSLVIVRDPIRRFVSALHHHFREHYQGVGIDGLGTHEKISLFQRFIRSDLGLAQVLEDPRYVHFSLQKWFCALGDERVVEHVLHFEDQPLAAASRLIGQGLSTDHWRHENHVDKALLDDPLLSGFANDFYAEDHAFFSTLARRSVSGDQGPRADAVQLR